jgi:hypothetical protein
MTEASDEPISADAFRSARSAFNSDDLCISVRWTLGGIDLTCTAEILKQRRWKSSLLGSPF